MSLSRDNPPDNANRIKKMCFIGLNDNSLLDVLNKLDVLVDIIEGQVILTTLCSFKILSLFITSSS